MSNQLTSVCIRSRHTPSSSVPSSSIGVQRVFKAIADALWGTMTTLETLQSDTHRPDMKYVTSHIHPHTKHGINPPLKVVPQQTH